MYANHRALQRYFENFFSIQNMDELLILHQMHKMLTLCRRNTRTGKHTDIRAYTPKVLVCELAVKRKVQ